MKKRLFFFALAIVSMNFLSAQVVADFEDGTTGPLTLHVMGCGDFDNDAIHPVDETFMVVDNPDATGLNTSSKVLKFIRRGTDNGGMPWGGFWANIDPAIDVTVNKYAHVLVWKPAISPLKFKLEGSTTLETASLNVQAATNEWVDIVFDFTTLTGPYAVMSLMPDFADPFTTAADTDIFIDNILFNDDPTPFVPPTLVAVKFSVDMSYQTTIGNFDPNTDYMQGVLMDGAGMTIILPLNLMVFILLLLMDWQSILYFYLNSVSTAIGILRNSRMVGQTAPIPFLKEPTKFWCGTTMRSPFLEVYLPILKTTHGEYLHLM